MLGGSVGCQSHGARHKPGHACQVQNLHVWVNFLDGLFFGDWQEEGFATLNLATWHNMHHALFMQISKSEVVAKGGEDAFER